MKEIEKKFELMYGKLDDILRILIEMEEIESLKGKTEIEDCREAVDILATQIEVLRRSMQKV
jgi:polyhydroxyalkanoate synthesis regulator phasin